MKAAKMQNPSCHSETSKVYRASREWDIGISLKKMFYPLDVEPWELSEIPDSPDKKFLKNSVESILAEIPPIVFDDCTDGFIKEKSPTTAMAEHNKLMRQIKQLAKAKEALKALRLTLPVEKERYRPRPSSEWIEVNKILSKQRKEARAKKRKNGGKVVMRRLYTPKEPTEFDENLNENNFPVVIHKTNTARKPLSRMDVQNLKL